MMLDMHHGGALDVVQKAYPNAPKPWVDLSTGINPWPYPDTGVSAATLARLPTQKMYHACQTAIATAIG
ncbi:MAG: threonine-phosphate decarboxylase, partial [Pseudomonadota bacterium]